MLFIIKSGKAPESGSVLIPPAWAEGEDDDGKCMLAQGTEPPAANAEAEAAAVSAAAAAADAAAVADGTAAASAAAAAAARASQGAAATAAEVAKADASGAAEAATAAAAGDDAEGAAATAAAAEAAAAAHTTSADRAAAAGAAAAAADVAAAADAEAAKLAQASSAAAAAATIGAGHSHEPAADAGSLAMTYSSPELPASSFLMSAKLGGTATVSLDSRAGAGAGCIEIAGGEPLPLLRVHRVCGQNNAFASSTVFVAKAVPLPCDSSTFMAYSVPLPCDSTVSETVLLPCGPQVASRPGRLWPFPGSFSTPPQPGRIGAKVGASTAFLLHGSASPRGPLVLRCPEYNTPLGSMFGAPPPPNRVCEPRILPSQASSGQSATVASPWVGDVVIRTTHVPIAHARHPPRC